MSLSSPTLAEQTARRFFAATKTTSVRRAAFSIERNVLIERRGPNKTTIVYIFTDGSELVTSGRGATHIIGTIKDASGKAVNR